MKKKYYPVFLGQRAQETAVQRWGVLIEIKGITASLLEEGFDTYVEAEARAGELNRERRWEELRRIS